MTLILAQQAPASSSILLQLLNAFFVVFGILLPLVVVYYFIQFVRYSIRNQSLMIKRLDDIEKAIREK